MKNLRSDKKKLAAGSEGRVVKRISKTSDFYSLKIRRFWLRISAGDVKRRGKARQGKL